MRAFLLPQVTLPDIRSDHTSVPSIVSSFLVFDEVKVYNLGLSSDPLFPAPQETDAEMTRLRSRHELKTLESVWRAFTRAVMDDHYTVDEMLLLRYSDAANKQLQFFRNYEPLLDAGALTIGSWWKTANQGGLGEHLGELYRAGAYQIARMAMSDDLDEPISVGIPTARSLDTGFMGMLVRPLLLANDPGLMASRSTRTKDRVLRGLAVAHGTFHAAFSEKQEGAQTFLAEGDRALMMRLMELFAKIKAGTSEPNPAPPQHSVTETARRIMMPLLTNIPAIRPQSAEALLALRTTLSDELTEFRDSLRLAAIEQLGDDKDPSTERLAQIAEATFEIPLRRLKSRLKNPASDVLRHLSADNAVIGGTVALLMTQSFGLSAVAASSLGLTVPALAAVIRARNERQADERSSGLAFLLRAEGVVRKSR